MQAYKKKIVTNYQAHN